MARAHVPQLKPFRHEFKVLARQGQHQAGAVTLQAGIAVECLECVHNASISAPVRENVALIHHSVISVT